MTEVRLRIVFDTEPSHAAQAELRAKAEMFLREAAPGIELRMSQGAGSWWIDLCGTAPLVAAWLAPIVGAWTVKTALDYAYGRLIPSPCLGANVPGRGAVLQPANRAATASTLRIWIGRGSCKR